ncbi:MAG: hypothetical protein P4L55_12785 [Syntrophobacteraceae bacterium]|nr:hypothetical protein [Syntrophobacteraceae bacterium]
MKMLIFSLCLALLSLFSTVGANAHSACGKVYVPGHYGPHHQWVPAHHRNRHWVPAHRGPHGRIVPGHCA